MNDREPLLKEEKESLIFSNTSEIKKEPVDDNKTTVSLDDILPETISLTNNEETEEKAFFVDEEPDIEMSIVTDSIPQTVGIDPEESPSSSNNSSLEEPKEETKNEPKEEEKAEIKEEPVKEEKTLPKAETVKNNEDADKAKKPSGVKAIITTLILAVVGGYFVFMAARGYYYGIIYKDYNPNNEQKETVNEDKTVPEDNPQDLNTEVVETPEENPTEQAAPENNPVTNQ